MHDRDDPLEGWGDEDLDRPPPPAAEGRQRFGPGRPGWIALCVCAVVTTLVMEDDGVLTEEAGSSAAVEWSFRIGGVIGSGLVLLLVGLVPAFPAYLVARRSRRVGMAVFVFTVAALTGLIAIGHLAETSRI